MGDETRDQGSLRSTEPGKVAELRLHHIGDNVVERCFIPRAPHFVRFEAPDDGE